MSQLVVYPYATSEEISVSSSNKLAVATYGEGGAKVYQKTTAPNYPATWSLLFSVNNEEKVYSFSADAVIRIDAGADKVFYSCTSVNPSAVEFQPQVPRAAHQYFNDFDAYVSGDWTNTTTGTGTVALGDAVNGFLVLTNSAADNDAVFLQKKGESFLFQSGKRLGFEARLKVSNATQTDLLIGLQITDTTPLPPVSNGVFFYKADDSTAMDFYVTGASTSTTVTGVATIADDTLVTLGFYFDGNSTLNYYVNRVLIGTASTTNLPTAEELTVSFGVQNGNGVARSMSIDYIYAWNDR